jgi:hypothetical protein
VFDTGYCSITVLLQLEVDRRGGTTEAAPMFRRFQIAHFLPPTRTPMLRQLQLRRLCGTKRMN